MCVSSPTTRWRHWDTCYIGVDLLVTPFDHIHELIILSSKAYIVYISHWEWVHHNRPYNASLRPWLGVTVRTVAAVVVRNFVVSRKTTADWSWMRHDTVVRATRPWHRFFVPNRESQFLEIKRRQFRITRARAGVNSAPELEFIANFGIELELPSLELNWNCHHWNRNWIGIAIIGIAIIGIYTTKGAACVCKIWPISARTLSFRHQTSRKFFSHSNFPIPYLWTAFCVPLSFVLYEKQ